MIIKEWNTEQLIVTDNVLTNLPISKLSSIPAATDITPDDLFLISKPCDPANMTETGYMSYQASIDDLSAYLYTVFDIEGINTDIDEISANLNRMLTYEALLQRIRDARVELDVYDDDGRFNPYIISSITELSGVLDSLDGYMLTSAMEEIFGWHKFNKICADDGYFDDLHATNIETTNLEVTNINNMPFQYLSVMTDQNYNKATTVKKPDVFYFTY